MAGFNNRLLQNQLTIAKGLLGFGASPLNVIGQFRCLFHQTHTTATPAGRGLDHQWVADIFGGVDEFFVAGIVALEPRHHRHTGFLHGNLRSPLTAHQLNSRLRWPDKHQAGVFAGPGKPGILRQEPIPRVHAIRPGFPRRLNNRLCVQIRRRYLSRSDTHRLVGQFHVQGLGVCLGIHCHRPVSQRLRGFDHPYGDFASVRYQELF